MGPLLHARAADHHRRDACGDRHNHLLDRVHRVDDAIASIWCAADSDTQVKVVDERVVGLRLGGWICPNQRHLELLAESWVGLCAQRDRVCMLLASAKGAGGVVDEEEALTSARAAGSRWSEEDTVELNPAEALDCGGGGGVYIAWV